jgi:WbqC-like protein family
MTTVAIHQPNFLPWLGYFQKIYASDIFIFHDAVEFTKRSFTQQIGTQYAETFEVIRRLIE